MDTETALSLIAAPLAVVVVALVLTRVAIGVTRRFERHYISEDGDEAARITGLQRARGGADGGVLDLRQKRALTISTLLRTTAIVIVWTVAALVILGVMGLPVTPLLAAAGVGGIAVGFGAQGLIKDVINGFFIVLERQYDVGDTIAIAGVGGTVERIDLRATVLRDIDGRRHVVPNGEVRVSTNLTHTLSRYSFTLPVPYEHDVDQAIEIAHAVANELRAGPDGALITEPLHVLGVDDFGESSVDVRLYLETVPGRQWEVGREYRRRLKVALEAAGIAIPYPHREVIVRRASVSR